MSKKQKQVKITPKIHSRNRHEGRYDFTKLIAASPELAAHIKPNLRGEDSIDFANPESVKALNKAILIAQYGLTDWNIPPKYLCPPIPGRADYMHHMADLLCSNNFGKIPTGSHITCLDIGVGASCIYPIVGRIEYGWSFIASDIDPTSIESSQQIVDKNDVLKDNITLRLQEKKDDILYGVITQDERIDFTVCNPPFHSSAEDAMAGSSRKVKNLSNNRVKKVTLNFGGQPNELWCEGGERKFVKELIRQSKNFANCCFWYSTLVSKQTNLKGFYEALNTADAIEVKTIPMGQGNKTSRILAWTFLSKEQQKQWKTTKWKVS